MTASAICTAYVYGRRIRVTKLDSCGRPVEGDASVVTSSGFISVAYTTNTDSGTEIKVPNAAGETIVRAPAIPKFLGHTVNLSLGNVDPELFHLMTGQEVYRDYDDKIVGFTTDEDIVASDTAFALELWMGVVDGDVCDDPNAQGAYGYVLLPFVQGGVPGDFTVENDAVKFTIQDAATKRGTRWGTGPYDIMLDDGGLPAPLPTALASSKHMLLIEVAVAPPAAQCGARPFMAYGGDPITSVVPTPTLLSVSFAVTAPSSDPFWIDFGDGEWDYSATGAPLVHAYGGAGTYDYVAYRGTSVKTGSVTVAAS